MALEEWLMKPPTSAGAASKWKALPTAKKAVFLAIGKGNTGAGSGPSGSTVFFCRPNH